MERLGSALLDLRTNVAPLREGMMSGERIVQSSLTRMEGNVGRRMASMGAGMGRIGSNLTRTVTVPILGIAGAAAKMSADFSRSMEMVHTQSGATQQEVNKLSKEVLALAGNLKQGAPQSALELSNALYRLEGAGLRGQKAMDALKASAQLAAVGNASVEDTAKTLAQTWFVGIKGAGNFKDTVAELNATIGTGDLRLQQLVDALGVGILPAAKQVGLTLHDVTGAMAVFGDETNNVSGFSAQLATAFHFLTNPTSKATGALESLGLTQTSLSEDLHKPRGLLTALTDLKDHLEKLPGGLHGVKADQVIGDILPGGRGRVLLLLMNQLDRYKGKMDAIAAGHAKFGEAVQKSVEQPAVKAEAAWHHLQAKLIEFGQVALVPMLDVGQKVLKFAEDAFVAFNKLPPGMKNTLMTGGLILAGIGPAMRLLGFFTTGVGRLASVAAIATRLVGKGFGAGAAASAARAAGTTVATMEVAEMFVRSMVGGSAPGKWSPKSGTSTTPVGSPRGGVPEPVPAGGPGLLKTVGGRLVGGAMIAGMGVMVSQAIGAAIPGAIGQGISKAGTDAAIGAGVGSIFGPAGMAGGAILGGLYGTLKFWVDHKAEQEGKDWSQKFSQGLNINLSAEQSKKFGDGLAKQYAQVRKTINESASIKDVMGGDMFSGDMLSKMVTAEQKKLAPQMWKLGWLAQQMFRTAFDKGQHKSTPTFIADAEDALGKLPPAARAAAAKGMLVYAQELVRKGQLPKNAMKGIIESLKGQFPGLAMYFRSQGLNTTRAIQASLNLNATQKNMASELNKMRGLYSNFSGETRTDNKHIGQNFSDTYSNIELFMTTHTGKAKKAALRDLAELRTKWASYLGDMADVTNNKTVDIQTAIQNGTAGAAASAQKNFYNVWWSVNQAMQAGAITAKQGAKIIGESLNVMLSAFGQDPIPLAGLSAASLTAWKNWWTAGGGTGGGSGTAGQPGHRAKGGLVTVGREGARGRDNIPLSVGGATKADIVVGEGEKLAVFNHDQQRVMDQALWRRGGLAGMFNGVRTNHYAGGGIVESYGQLEGLWDQAGGARNMASLMAAIAEAESSGNTRAYNASGASGLWQILGLPFPGDPFDALTNARMAVAKYNSQGLGAWVAYTSGAYKQFMRGNVPASAGGAAFRNIPVPHVTGSGTISKIDQAMLNELAKAADKYGRAHQPQPAAASPGAAGPSGGPAGVGTFGGFPVAKWIIPELEYARAHGWTGNITSGYRDHLVAGETHLGEHSGIQYPHGAVDFGGGWGYWDPVAAANRAAFESAARGYKGRRLIEPIGFVDWGHMSGTGHAKGGWIKTKATVDDFTGGAMQSGLPTSYNKGNTFAQLLMGGVNAGMHPNLSDLLGRGGGILPPGFSIDVQYGSKELDDVRRIDTGSGQAGDARYTVDLERPASNRLAFPGKGDIRVRRHGDQGGKHGHKGMPHHGKKSPKQKRVQGGTTGATGTTGTKGAGRGLTKGQPGPMAWSGLSGVSWIDEAMRRLEEYINTDIPIDQDLYQHWSGMWDTENLTFVVTPTDGSAPYIDEAAVQKRLGELHKLAGWQTQVLQWSRDAHKLAVPLGTHIAHAITHKWGEVHAKQKIVRANLHTIDKLSKHMPKGKAANAVKAQIKSLKDMNEKLTGDRTKVGTAGEVGFLEKQITRLKTLGDTSHQDDLSMVGVSGQGGLTGDTKITLADLANQIKELDTSPGGALWQQLQSALSGSGSSDNSTLIGLLEEKNAALGRSYQTLLAQTSVFDGLPPFGGSFALGGIVPGAVGEPRTIIAHGGEEVGDGSGKLIKVIIEDGAVDSNKIRVIAGDAAVQVINKTSRSVRPLAGSRYGT